MNFNIINFVQIVDLSLLNFLDYAYVNESQLYENADGKLVVNLDNENKKVLEAYIINNINDNIQYGKNNLIVNTCQPMQNWRQVERNHALKRCKYKIVDDSVYVDEIKLNQLADKIFRRLPKLTEHAIKKTFNALEYTNADELREKSVSDLIKRLYMSNNINFIEFEAVDIHDAYDAIKTCLMNIGDLNFLSFNYNVVADGNDDYMHCHSFPDEVLEDVRLNLKSKGII